VDVTDGLRQAQGPTLSSPTFDDDQFGQRAISSFLDDFVVRSANRKISRGFLDGLNSMTDDVGPSSDIAQAMRIIAIAAAANKMGRIDILRKTKSIYGKLLGSFRSTLENPYTRSTMHSLMTVALLGIYEVCVRYLVS
jgi:hypothetical protein